MKGQKKELRAKEAAEKRRKKRQSAALRAHKREERRAVRREKISAWRREHGKGLRTAKKVSYHLLACLAIAGIAVLGCCRAQGSFLRFWESLKDLFSCMGSSPSVIRLPQDMIEGFPRALEEFAAIAKNFGSLFIRKENFLAYLSLLGVVLEKSLYGLLYAVFPLSVIVLWCVWSLNKKNRDYGKKSLPLRAFLAVRESIFLPLGRYLRGLVRFLRKNKAYPFIMAATALFFLNVYTIAIEAVAYYLYFLVTDTVTFDFGLQIVKLAYDLFMAFRFLPVWVWALIGVWLFDRWRKSVGYSLLEKYEEDLRTFLGKRGVNILICGAPRTGKTTTLVSIVKSLMAESRKNAKSGMREIEMKFPDFPWIVFEKMIRKDYARRRFRNLYHLREWTKTAIANAADEHWLKTLRKQYRSCCATRFEYPFFNYDREHFPTEYKGALGVDTIEECLIDYAQLYFIYIQPMQIIANFSIRSDNDLNDLGNFPEWRDDFFRHEPDRLSDSAFAKILNQDLLRPGKQVDPTCQYKDCFEFGVIAETEVGKERGNQFDHAGRSAASAEANVRNDQRDNLFKLMGHLGTTYNIPFAFYCGDEQRPGSWGANGKDLCDVVTIRERRPDVILLPFFAFEELLYVIVKKFFGNYYDHTRMQRGDTTLLTYLLTHVCRVVIRHYKYISDKFGGHFNKVNVEQAMRQEGDAAALSKDKIFIANAKVYAKTFRTAGWKPFMERRAANCGFGLEDMPSFHGLDPYLDEFLEMRSYFFTELLKNFSGEEQERALDVVVRSLTEFYQSAEEQFDKKTARGLLEELTEALPDIVKEDDFAAMKRKLSDKRKVLLQKAKKAQDEAEAKEKNAEGGKGKKQADEASAAAK